MLVHLQPYHYFICISISSPEPADPLLIVQATKAPKPWRFMTFGTNLHTDTRPNIIQEWWYSRSYIARVVPVALLVLTHVTRNHSSEAVDHGTISNCGRLGIPAQNLLLWSLSTDERQSCTRASKGVESSIFSSKRKHTLLRAGSLFSRSGTWYLFFKLRVAMFN
jgi:hypothetical protein